MLAVSFIIVNYNTYTYTLNSITTLKQNLKNIKYEIILIDNNSKEIEINNITKYHKDVKYFKLKNNIGYSQANNFAVEKCSYPVICFVNPDIVFTSVDYFKIINYVIQNKEAGACAPILTNKDYSLQFSFGKFPSFLIELMEALYLIKIYRMINTFFTLKYKKEPIEVDWVSGAFLMIRKEHFESINGFDPDFFLNFEDIDLCKRLRLNNFKNYVFPSLKCVHFGNSSFYNEIGTLVITRYQSRLLYWKKYKGYFYLKILILVHLLGLLIRILFIKLFKPGRYIERSACYLESLRFLFGNLFSKT